MRKHTSRFASNYGFVAVFGFGPDPELGRETRCNFGRRECGSCGKIRKKSAQTGTRIG